VRLAPQIEIWNTINQWSFVNFQDVKPRCTKRKAPLLKTFWTVHWTICESLQSYIKQPVSLLDFNKVQLKIFALARLWQVDWTAHCNNIGCLVDHTSPAWALLDIINNAITQMFRDQQNKLGYHRCRSERIFGDAKKFCTNFPKLAQKVVVQILPTVFWCDLQKWSLLLFLQTLSAIFEVKQRWAPYLSRFSGILPRYLGILFEFSDILPKFLEILPKFSTNQNFWGCAYTRAPPPPIPQSVTATELLWWRSRNRSLWPMVSIMVCKEAIFRFAISSFKTQ